LKAPLVHQQAFLFIFRSGIGLVSVEVIASMGIWEIAACGPNHHI